MESKSDSEGTKIRKLSWEDVRIISHTFDDWEVELYIPFDQVSEEKLPEKLKHIKELISEKYDLPVYSLQYQSLIQKDVTDYGVFTLLRMKRVALDRSKPKLTFHSAMSPSGFLYSDMVCTVDLFLLDEFEHELTDDRVWSLLEMEGVKSEFVDRKAISQAIAKVKEESRPFLGSKIAQGKFPDTGLDAEVEFYFHAQPSLGNLDEYVSSRKVNKDDLLCSKILPQKGKYSGMSLHGKEIPPRQGLDLKLIGGKNTRVSLDGAKIFSEIYGLAVIRREERSFMTPRGEKIVPSAITVRVDPILVIDAGEEAVEITTNDSVEVRGALKMGSRIISSGEVHIEGDVGEDSIIHATDDVVLEGQVKQGDVTSDRNIIARNGICGGKVSAGGNVVVAGVSNNATIVGKQVFIDKISGGKIIAGKSLTTNELGADEKGLSATICIATRDFLKNKIDENDDFLQSAKSNLEKMRAFFGEQIVEEVFSRNVQQMFLKFLSNLRREGKIYLSQNMLSNYKKLLTSVEPLKQLIREKGIENIAMSRQIRQSAKEKKLVIVREKVSARTKVVIDDTARIIEPQTGPLELSESDLKKLKEENKIQEQTS
jgi:uncharacterized protein (DUF342 family)